MTIQTCGSYDGEDQMYSLIVGFEQHAMTLDGLTREDMENLKSCIDCMLGMWEPELDPEEEHY